MKNQPYFVIKTNGIKAGVIELTREINSDRTGKLPFKYVRGNIYIMVIYDCDRNSIPMKSMKNCDTQSIGISYEKLYNSLVTKGFKPRQQNFDYGASKLLIQSLQDKNIEFQLVPPNIHCRNAAE